MLILVHIRYFVSKGESWPVIIGVKVIVIILDPIKLAMPILQWNLSAAIEKWLITH